jgi:hypothetical protein
MRHHLPRLILTVAALTGMLLATPSVGAAGPGVHGRVLGHNEQGSLLGIVAGAKIQFQNAAGQAVAQTTADNNGYYKVDLPPGEYLYKIQAPGYRDENAGRGMHLVLTQGYAIFNLALTQGENDPTAKPPDVKIKRIGKLHGRVFELKPDAMVGIPDARILLRREGTPRLINVISRDAAESQEAGAYAITLEEGTYHAAVIASGYETLQDPEPIVITAGEDAERDFPMKRPQPEQPTDQGIRGVVTLVDSGAAAANPPIKIEIKPLGLTPGDAVEAPPSSNGAFIQELPSGAYQVTASAEGFPTETRSPVYVFDGKYTKVNLVLRAERVPPPPTTVDVFVYTRASEAAAPLPVPNATVSLMKSDADPATAQAGATDGAGHAVFQVTEAGQYVAEAHHAGFTTNSATGTVTLGQSHEVGIELKKGTAPTIEQFLTVTVIDAVKKRPLPRVSVLARHEQGSLADAARGVTDDQGKVSLQVARTGDYTVLAQMAGYQPAGAKTTVLAAQANTVLLTLAPISSHKPSDEEPVTPVKPEVQPVVVSGYVAYREITGQLRSAPGARLVWERLSPAFPRVTEFATSAGNGAFRLELPEGTYQVRVAPPSGFEDLLEQVKVVVGMPKKYFLLRRSGTQPPTTSDLVDVRGVVVAETASGQIAGVPGAEVLFLGSKGAERAQTTIGGSFHVSLPKDAYRVLVRAQGYEQLESSGQVHPGMSPLRFVLKSSVERPKSLALHLKILERAQARFPGLMRPVPGAHVQIVQQGRLLTSGTSDNLGSYSSRLSPGAYSVRVSKSGYAAATEEIVLSSQDVTRTIMLGKEAPESDTPSKPMLTVRVTTRTTQPPSRILPTGQPVAGAQVAVISGAQRVASGTTSAAGLYSIALPPGAYSIKVEAAGFAPAGQVTMHSARGATVDFQLTRTAGGDVETLIRPEERKLLPPGLALPRDGLTKRATVAQYAVEYRIALDSTPWREYGRYPTQHEAQRALFFAVEHGRIPRAAETRIVLK